MSPQPLLTASLLVRTAWLAEAARQPRLGAKLRQGARRLTRTAPTRKASTSPPFGGPIALAVALVLGLDAAR